MTSVAKRQRNEVTMEAGCPRRSLFVAVALAVTGWAGSLSTPRAATADAAGGRLSAARPNIVLVMADDQGWGDVGYHGHPALKTPNLDKLAAEGLRLDRFYAASPVCSPTRASVLTGRNPLRCGVPNWGCEMNSKERTLAQILKEAGYRAAHFGKWHLAGEGGKYQPVLNGMSGNPGQFGFDEWASVCNFFDLHPTLGVNGVPRKFEGDGSDVIVSLANEFMDRCVKRHQPFFALVWYGSPHVPHKGLPHYRAPYAKYAEKGQFPRIAKHQLRNKATIPDFYAEIAGIDHSVGALRAKLEALGVADNTLIWYTSDNGGLIPELSQPNMKGLKGDTWEGGLRVPGFIVWPCGIPKAKRSALPCSTMDIYPTILAILGLSETARSVLPLDGQDISPLFTGEMTTHRPIPISYQGNEALVDRHYKLHNRPKDEKPFQLYDLEADPGETRDVATQLPEVAARLKGMLEEWRGSLVRSRMGADSLQER